MKQMRAALRRFLMAGAVTSNLALAATAQTQSLLYSFSGANDGASPQEVLTPNGKGNYFGVAIGGGAGSAGVVFELSPNSSGGLDRTGDLQLHWLDRLLRRCAPVWRVGLRQQGKPLWYDGGRWSFGFDRGRPNSI
jgi:hypothetical protein